MYFFHDAVQDIIAPAMEQATVRTQRTQYKGKRFEQPFQLNFQSKFTQLCTQNVSNISG